MLSRASRRLVGGRGGIAGCCGVLGGLGRVGVGVWGRRPVSDAMGPAVEGLEHLAWPLWPEDEAAALQAPDGVTVVQTKAEARRVVEILEKLPKSTWHAWDTEVANIDVTRESPVVAGDVLCATFYCGPNVDFGSGPKVFVDNWAGEDGGGEGGGGGGGGGGAKGNGVLDAFRGFLEQNDVNLVFHNFGFDRHALFRAGIDITHLGADTMHLARQWDTARALRGGYSLESLSHDLLGDRKVPMKEIFALPKLRRDGSPGKEKVLPPMQVLHTDPRFRSAWIDYATYDAEATWRIRNVLEDKLRARPWKGQLSQWDFAQQYLAPFALVLTDLERNGIRVDSTHHLPKAEAEARKHREQAAETFIEWASGFCEEARRMNVSSDVQKAHFLFAPATKEVRGRRGGAGGGGGVEEWPRERAFKVENVEGFVEEGKTKPKKQRDLVLTGLGIPAVARTAAGWPAASAAVLRKLAGDPEADPPRWGLAFEHFGGGEAGRKACEAIHALVEVSAIDTMLSNFIIPLQTMVDEQSRVHCSLNLNTETGRLSARRPNLQNQPALEKDRYKVREAFCAAPGNKLVVADYGQLELRILAHMAGCKSMIQAFEDGGDFHSRTALGMYPHIKEAVENKQVVLEEGDISSTSSSPAPVLLKHKYASERRKAKVLNFSIAYGKTPAGLAKDWGVTLPEAKETLERWYADRPEVRDWQRQVLEITKTTGSTRTLMGRHRDLPDINSKDYRKRGRAERAAINTPIQGGAADVVMMAMLKIHADTALQRMGWKMLLQIHDEVILEGPQETAEEAKQRLVECMAHPFKQDLSVQLVVDANIADNWYEGK